MGSWAELLADKSTFEAGSAEPESLGWGKCEIAGHSVVLVWCDFGFKAGTLSVAAGRELQAAVDVAVSDTRPVIAIANSGGARMQEGPRAFVQMLSATVAVAKLREAKLPFITYLAHPTTGGVLGSWATAGDVVLAEPEAVIAFTGPRVAAALGTPIEPAEVQTAAGQLDAGQVDALVPRGQLAEMLARLLDIALANSYRSASSSRDCEGTAITNLASDTDAADELPRGWRAVEASRSDSHGDPLTRFLTRADSCVELLGDRQGADEHDVATMLCRFGERSVLLVAHRRSDDGSMAKPSEVGMRKVLRTISVAQRLGLGLITLIDTDGANISGEGEAEGMARLVSTSLQELMQFDGPTVSVLAGQGSGGIALALFPADTSISTSDSWMAPISPEAASLIVHRDTDHAAEMSDDQKLSAVELYEAGIVDRVVHPDEIVDAALCALDESDGLGDERLEIRMSRFAHIAQKETKL